MKLIKNKFKLLILAFIFSFSTNAQEKTENESVVIEVNQNTKTIYVLGGIMSVITKEDLAFAKKHNFKFDDFGCLAPVNFEIYETKNALVFEYLNTTFGKQWQEKMKPNAMGFEKWKKK